MPYHFGSTFSLTEYEDRYVSDSDLLKYDINSFIDLSEYRLRLKYQFIMTKKFNDFYKIVPLCKIPVPELGKCFYDRRNKFERSKLYKFDSCPASLHTSLLTLIPSESKD